MSVEEASQNIINAADRKIKLSVFPTKVHTGLIAYNLYPPIVETALLKEAMKIEAKL